MTLPSGYVPLQYGIEAADTLAGEKYAPGSVGSRSPYTEVEHPVTGNKIEGWKWDEKLPVDDTTSNFNTSIPLIFDGSTVDVSEDYFQSGIGDNQDLTHLNTERVTISGIGGESYIPDAWIAEVEHGHFFDAATPWYLYGDDSEVHLLTSGLVIGGISQALNQVELQYQPKLGIPITARRYQWNTDTLNYTPNFSIRQKMYFTGVKVGDLREDTYNSDTQAILYDKMDTSNPEFIVTYSGGTPRIIFNNQFSEAIGEYPTVSGLEQLGYSNGEYSQQFHTQYAPLDPLESIRVFSWQTPTIGVKEWVTQSGLAYPLLGDSVGIDYELGLVEFPSLSGDLLPAGHSVGVTYNAGILVEYEPAYTTDLATAFEADLNPLRKHQSNNFFYISTDAETPTAIELSAMLPWVSSSLYGPLYLGNTFATLVATVTDEDGEPAENAEIHFEITSTPSIGSFGSSLVASSITDDGGLARAFYTPPTSTRDMSEEVGAADIVVYPALNQTIITLDEIPLEGNVDDIFLFQVYTDDALLGYRNPLIASDPETQLNDYYVNFFTEHGIWGETGLAATGILAPHARFWENTRRLIWGLSTPEAYEAAAGKGKKLLVATEDVSALDPHSYTSPAVVPFQPISVVETASGYNLVYDTSAVSIPVPSGYLASYLVVAPVRVAIRAYYDNVRSRTRIYSNTIEIKIAIPPSMNGLWIINTLNDVATDEISAILAALSEASVLGKKVPLGFRLKSSNVTLAGALAGVVFLDVNRLYNQDAWTPVRFKFGVI